MSILASRQWRTAMSFWTDTGSRFILALSCSNFIFIFSSSKGAQSANYSVLSVKRSSCYITLHGRLEYLHLLFSVSRMDGRNLEKVTTVEERFWIHSTDHLCLHKREKSCIILSTFLFSTCVSFSSVHLAQPWAQPDAIFLFLNPFFSISPSGRAGDVCEPETVARSMPPAAQKYTQPTCQHPCAVVLWLGNMCLAGPAEPLVLSDPQLGSPPLFILLIPFLERLYYNDFPVMWIAIKWMV